MSISMWVMLLIGCAILYGGLTTCLIIAYKNRGKAEVDDEEAVEEGAEKK